MIQVMLEKGIGNPEVEGGSHVNEAGTIVTRLKCTPIHVEMAHDPTLVHLHISKKFKPFIFTISTSLWDSRWCVGELQTHKTIERNLPI
jgi:hypothetical protein